jgi:hypothetical protein
MIFNVHGEEFEATPENAAIFTGTTLIQGLYIDYPDNYLFVPDDPEIIPDFAAIAARADEEGIPIYELDSYDPESEPFCFIINALCRVWRDEIDDINV